MILVSSNKAISAHQLIFQSTIIKLLVCTKHQFNMF